MAVMSIVKVAGLIEYVYGMALGCKEVGEKAMVRECGRRVASMGEGVSKEERGEHGDGVWAACFRGGRISCMVIIIMSIRQ